MVIKLDYFLQVRVEALIQSHAGILLGCAAMQKEREKGGAYMYISPMHEQPALAGDKEEQILLEQIAQNSQLIVQTEQKRLLLSKIQLGLTAFLAGCVLLALLLWGPGLHRALQRADQVFDNLESLSSQLAEADISGLLAGIDQLAQIDQSSLKAMEKAAELLEKIDADRLNEAISDLQKAMAPLAKLFG